MASVRIEFPARSAYVGVARLALSVLARGAGLDEEQVDDLKIAASEACANAVLRHEEAGVDEPVKLEWRDEPGQIVVEIADHGAAVDPAHFDDEGEPYSRLRMSVALLRGLVDDCAIGPGEDGGLRTRLVLQR